ncbi:hypothetical protein ABZ439_00585 [Streptomyces sp. NPDC005840]
MGHNLAPSGPSRQRVPRSAGVLEHRHDDDCDDDCGSDSDSDSDSGPAP